MQPDGFDANGRPVAVPLPSGPYVPPERYRGGLPQLPPMGPGFLPRELRPRPIAVPKRSRGHRPKKQRNA